MRGRRAEKSRHVVTFKLFIALKLRRRNLVMKSSSLWKNKVLLDRFDKRFRKVNFPMDYADFCS